MPAERVTKELERAKQGAFVKLSREEFEARVARAARAGVTTDAVRLLEARYHANFTETGLIGRAQWVLHNPGPGAAVWALPGFSLAVRRASFESADAVLGELDGKTLGVLVEKPGKQTLSLEWSTRGDERPTGVTFSLRVPPCVLQSLELELPAERSLLVPREMGLVSGPLATESPDRHSWRLDCAGQSRMDLTVRKPPPAGEPALVLAGLQTEQTLAIGSVETQFTLRLDVVRGTLQEFRCVGDPDWRVYRVTAGEHEVESYSETRDTPAGPPTLLVRLREPVHAPAAVVVTMRGLTTLSSPKGKSKSRTEGVSWNSPGLRPLNVTARGEALVLRVPPEVRLTDWEPGRFILTQSTFDAEGRQTLTLQGSIDDPASVSPPPKGKPTPVSTRPRARLRLQEPEFRTRQQVWWKIGPTEQTLTANLTFQVTHGTLHRLHVTIPPWAVHALELRARVEGRDLATANLVRTSAVVPGDANAATLVVDLLTGIGPAAPAHLSLKLRHESPRGTGLPASLSFPLLAVSGSSSQESILAVTLDPVHQATVATSGLEVAPEARLGERFADLARDPPWGRELPDHLYVAHGQPMTGVVTLRTLRAQVRARCRTRIQLGAGRLSLTTELHVEPSAGNPEALDLWFSAPIPAAESWRTLHGNNSVARVERTGAAGQEWRLVLARPLREPLTLQATWDLTHPSTPAQTAAAVTVFAAPTFVEILSLSAAVFHTIPGGSSDAGWDVPLPAILSAERMDGEAALYFSGSQRVEVDAKGLTEAPAAPRVAGPAPRRLFRYEQLPVALRLRGGAASSERGPDAVVESARLVTTLQRDGQMAHHYTCRIWDWRQRTLPVVFPAGTELLAARTNGRWMVLPPAAPTSDGRLVVELPMPGVALSELELAYTSPSTPRLFGARLYAPVPELPLAPLATRRTWRLPPEWTPLDERALLRLPGSVGPTTVHGLPWQPDNPADADTEAWLLTPWRTTGEPRWRTRQRQTLVAAAARAASATRAGTEAHFGAFLHTLAFEAAQEEHVVVLDTVALAQAGLSTATPVPAERVLESLDLLHIPCRAGALLTTRRQADQWHPGGSTNPAAALAEAITLAATQGRDASGRFRRAPDWLREQGRPMAAAELVPETPRPEILASLGTSVPAGWIEWNPLTGERNADTMLVVRADVLPGLALVLSAAVLVIAWGGRGWAASRRVGLLLLVLTLGMLGIMWLPEPLRLLAFWPSVAAGCVAVVWYLGTLLAPPAHQAAPPTNHSRVTAATVVLLALAGTLAGQGENSVPTTVWLLPDATGAGGLGGVLVPPALLEQLDTLARRSPSPAGAVLIGAAYKGQAQGETAEFTADLRVHHFAREEASELLLPLTGIELQEALLDGAPAYLTAAPDQSGYLVKLKGPGAHVLRLRFSTRIRASESGHEVRFGIPRLARSQLTLHLRAPATDVHVVFGPMGGARQTIPHEGGVRLEADLGRTGTLHARWRTGDVLPQQTKVEVHEAYLWQHRPTDSRLQGTLQFFVRQGSVATLSVNLPESLEVSRVETFPVPGHSPAPRLISWRVERAKPRRLLLNFQTPLTDAVRVELELIPTRPAGLTPELALPTPSGVVPLSGLLAVDLQGLEALGAENLRLTAVAAELFLKSWKSAGLSDPGPLAFRYSFRRGTGGGAAPQLTLRLAPPRPQVVHLAAWHVGPDQADLHATARVSTLTHDEPDLVEWEVPPSLTIVQVRGPHVRTWTARAGRVQVWLQRSARDTPLTETTVELLGRQARTAKNPTFTPPRVRVLNAARQTHFVRVTAQESWALEPANLRGLLPLPSSHLTSRELEYVAQDENATGTFRLVPAGAGTPPRLLTFLETREGRLHFVTTLDYRPGPNEPRTLTLRLRNWDGGEVRLEGSHIAGRRDHGSDSARRSWTLDLEPNSAGVYQLRLLGSRPLDAGGLLPVPDISVAGVTAERWVAVAGPDLQADAVLGLRTVANAVQALVLWTSAADRIRRVGGSVWKVESADWQLRLRTRRTSGMTTAVQLVWVEHALAAAEGRWLGETTCWLHHSASADVYVRLPERTTLLAVTLDGQDLVPLPAARDRFWLALPAAATRHRVRFRWLSEANSTAGGAPRLAAPRLEGVAEGPTFWTVHVPPGHVLHAAGPGVEAAGQPALELHRAAALLQLSTLLAPTLRDTSESETALRLEWGLERFYRQCRFAEYLLQIGGSQSGEGSKGQTLSDWLQELRDQARYLAGEYDFERLRGRAERLALTPRGRPEETDENRSAITSRLQEGLLNERGLPTYWLTRAGDAAETLRMEPGRGNDVWPAALGTLLLAGIAALAWRLRHVPNAMAWLHQLWPELLAAGGVACWGIFGLAWLGVALLSCGLVARFSLLLRRWRALFNTTALPTPAGLSGR